MQSCQPWLNDICVSKTMTYGRGRRGVRLRLHDSMRLCPFCLRVHWCNSPDARFEVDESRHQGRSCQGCEYQFSECQRKQTRVTEFTPMKCFATAKPAHDAMQFTAAPFTCNIMMDTAGLQSAMFDCASDTVKAGLNQTAFEADQSSGSEDNPHRCERDRQARRRWYQQASRWEQV